MPWQHILVPLYRFQEGKKGSRALGGGEGEGEEETLIVTISSGGEQAADWTGQGGDHPIGCTAETHKHVYKHIYARPHTEHNDCGIFLVF